VEKKFKKAVEKHDQGLREENCGEISEGAGKVIMRKRVGG